MMLMKMMKNDDVDEDDEELISSFFSKEITSSLKLPHILPFGTESSLDVDLVELTVTHDPRASLFNESSQRLGHSGSLVVFNGNQH